MREGDRGKHGRWPSSKTDQCECQRHGLGLRLGFPGAGVAVPMEYGGLEPVLANRRRTGHI